MGFLEGFNFKIFRLRDAKEMNEFVLHDIKNNKYNTYSQRRILSVLKNEIYSKGYDIDEVLRKINGIDKAAKIKVDLILNRYIDEELVLLDNIGFKPIKDKVFEEDGISYFNTFCQPPTLDKFNYEIKKQIKFKDFKKNCKAIYKLLFNLHGKDDAAIEDSIYKLADKIQNPHMKGGDCGVYYPAEGAGKGVYYKHIICPIFGKYAKKVLMQKLDNDFNGYLKECLYLVLEEGKRNKNLLETLKELITESELLVNEKGKPQNMARIYFKIDLFSNEMNPADLGKRRGSYFQCHSLGKTKEETQKIGSNLCLEIPKELNYFLKYLHNLNIDHQKALIPFNTLAKTQVNDLNKNAMELFFDHIIQFPNIQNAFADLYKRQNFHGNFDYGINEIKEIMYISKDSFKEAYNIFCQTEGLRNNIIRHNKDIVQLWALLKVPVNAHRRITIKDGSNAGRKLDHVELDIINQTIKELYLENESN